MKAKDGFFIFIAGCLLHLIGAWLKISHWVIGNIFLLAGFLLEGSSLIFLAIKVLREPRFKNFLNR